MIDKTQYNINSLSIVHEKICAYFEVDYLVPFQRSTKRSIVYMRQLFHYIAKKVCNKRIISPSDIANYLNDILKPFDRTTVIYSCKKIEGYLTYDKQVMSDVKGVLELLPRI